MQELILKWLPTFVLIIGVVCLLPNIIIGLFRSLRDVLGYSNEWLLEDDSRLKRALQLLFSGGAFSVIGGIFWIFLVHQGRVGETTVSDGIVVGGILGLIGYCMGKKLIPSWKKFNRSAALVGGLSGGIGSGMFSGLLEGTVEHTWKVITTTMFVSVIVYGVLSGGIKKSDYDKEWMPEKLAIGTFLVAMPAGILFALGVVVTLGDEFALPFSLGLAGGIVILLFPLAEMTARIGAWVITPVLILLKFKPSLCPHCLRYTAPLKSQYRNGIRYCEHCQQAVEHTKERGEVVFTFGYPLEAKGRQFILSNPDFEHQNHPIDVAKIYIETSTCDKPLLERFLTYIVNYPPTHNLQSVQVFYRGTLDELGKNLKNALQNTFKQVEQID